MLCCNSHAKLNKMGGENAPLNHITFRALSLQVHLALPNKNSKIALKSTAEGQKNLLQTEAMVPT